MFQRDQYAPHTDACRRTLAHELTHVLQQKAGPVDGTPTDGGLRLSHPDDRFEREATATAERVVQEQAIQRRVDGEDNEEAEQ